MKLAVPKGLAVRPTGARVREALFNKLRGQVTGCYWLDLFAGAGTMACEALSRGASKVVYVDLSSQSISACRINCQLVSKQVVQTTGKQPSSEFYLKTAEAVIARLGRRGDRFDVIFCDPPYELCAKWLGQHLNTVGRLLSPDGSLIVEASKRTDLSFGATTFRSVHAKNYGDTVLHFFSKPIYEIDKLKGQLDLLEDLPDDS